MNGGASELGRAIHARRTQLGMSLRELARRIEKAPSYLVALERSPKSPGASDETLRALARTLEINSDSLFGLANRTPADSLPESELEVAIYRAVKTLSEDRKRDLLKAIQAAAVQEVPDDIC